jgi:prepilin-type N-terminal cleavage/methylation domain-containing protein
MKQMKQHRKKNEKGMTLLEVLVAVFVLAVVALPLLNLFVFNTTLVRNAKNIGDTTYAAQAVMEDLQPLGYGDLYSLAPAPGAKGNYQIKSVMNSSTVYVKKQVSIDRIPYGAFNDLVSGAACYAHLIISNCGSSATFTCPDGTPHAGLSLSSTITLTSSTVTIGGNAYNLNKPVGAKLILIVNARTSPVPSLTINLPSDKSVTYVLYALSPSDDHVQNITVNNGSATSKEYRKFNSKTDASKDPPPSYMLVNAVCKVYNAGNSSLEGIVQNTLKVSLP